MERSFFNAVASTPLPTDHSIDIIIEIDNMPIFARSARNFGKPNGAQEETEQREPQTDSPSGRASVRAVTLVRGIAAVTPFTKASKSDTVYEAFKHAIMLGEMAPGTPLVESPLAAEIGCSQSTVREALMRLQEDGLVIRLGYRGTLVSSTSAVEAEEMLQLRLRIEVRGVERAVERLTDADLASLGKLIGDMETAARAGNEYDVSERDRAFHLQLFHLSDLPALEPILQRCLLHNHRFKIASGDRRRPLIDTAARHRHILAAFAGRDAAAAVSVIRHHIETIADGRRAASGAPPDVQPAAPSP